MNYLIISAALVPSVQFAQVSQTGPATVRYNEDNSKTFIKWAGTGPSTVADIYVGATEGVDYWGPFTEAEMKVELLKPEWNNNLTPLP